MNVLVAYDNPTIKPLADAIAQGAKELNATVTVKTTAENFQLAGFDFVFVGGVLDARFSAASFISKTNWPKTKAAVFCVKKKTGNLDAALQLLSQKGVQVEKNTFSALLEGPLAFVGMGKIKDADLIRARGFGERTLNVAFDLQIGKDTEKADKIKGYTK